MMKLALEIDCSSEDLEWLKSEITDLCNEELGGPPVFQQWDVSRRTEDIPAWWWQYKKANPDDKDDYDKLKHCCSRFWKDFCDCMR